LLLSYPEHCAATVEGQEVPNLDWFQDDRVRDLADSALALLAEGRGLSLKELAERMPETQRDALAAVEIVEGEGEDRILRRLGDVRDALELRHLRRELAGARSLAEMPALQGRIRALESRRSAGG
jgi:hypothetical protein